MNRDVNDEALQPVSPILFEEHPDCYRFDVLESTGELGFQENSLIQWLQSWDSSIL